MHTAVQQHAMEERRCDDCSVIYFLFESFLGVGKKKYVRKGTLSVLYLGYVFALGKCH